MPTRVVHQDAAHHACGDREELDAVLPPYAAEIHEPHVGLMDESCGCQRMIAAFGTETPARDPPQVQYTASISRLFAAGSPLPHATSHRGHVILGHTLLRGPSVQPKVGTRPTIGSRRGRPAGFLTKESVSVMVRDHPGSECPSDGRSERNSRIAGYLRAETFSRPAFRTGRCGDPRKCRSGRCA